MMIWKLKFIVTNIHMQLIAAFQWRHNEHGGISSHQPHDCLLNRLFRRRSKKTPKLLTKNGGGEGGQMGGGKKSVFWAGYLKKRGRGSEEKLGGGGGLNPGGRGSRPPVLAHGTSTRHRGQVTHRTLKCYRTLKQRKVKTPKVHDTNYANACMFPCQAQVETYITPGLSNALSQWQPYGRAFVYSVYHETFYF